LLSTPRRSSQKPKPITRAATTACANSIREMPDGGRRLEKWPACSVRKAGKYRTAATIATIGVRPDLRNRRTSARMLSASPTKSRPRVAKPRPVTFAGFRVSMPPTGVSRMSQTMYTTNVTARIFALVESFTPLYPSLFASIDQRTCSAAAVVRRSLIRLAPVGTAPSPITNNSRVRRRPASSGGLRLSASQGGDMTELTAGVL
jgi:hypothetical protein